MSRKLTIKQKQFVDAYVKLRNGEKAALKVYDTKDRNTARVIASENLTKPNVQQSIQNALNKRNIDIDKILEPVINGLSANKGDEEDHSIRLKSSDMLQTLTGMKSKEAPSLHFHKHIHEKGMTYDL